MKSGTSLFNKGLCLNFLKRSWPLWTAYLGAVIFALPLQLFATEAAANFAYGSAHYGSLVLNRDVYESAQFMVLISFVFAVLAAMLIFGYLYNNRSCGLMASLPIKRESIFVTACITGIAPMIAADIIAVLITLAAFSGSVHFTPDCLWTWLAMAIMTNIIFFSFAVFCAMLTGNLFVLPAVYVVLNCTAAVVELTVSSILSYLVYGYSDCNYKFFFLSPPFGLMDETFVDAAYTENNSLFQYSFTGLKITACYLAVSLVFLAAAFILYKNRRMETAGDTVAISVLKPIFKYCFTFGCSIVLAAVLFALIFQNSFSGVSAAVAIGIIMLIGAFVGYYAAEMLIHKTFSVLKLGYKGMAVCFLIIIAFVFTAESDITGYEKRLPSLDKIESVEFEGIMSYQIPKIMTDEGIANCIELHSMFIADKSELEKLYSDTSNCTLIYNMKDGSTIERSYRVSQTSMLASTELFWEIYNSPEVKAYRVPPIEEVKELEFDYCDVTYCDDDGADRFVNLNAEQFYELYENCVYPDSIDSELGKYEFYNQTDDEKMSYVTISVALSQGRTWRSLYYNVPMSAQRTLTYLEENYGVNVVTQAYYNNIRDKDIYPHAVG